ncbi:hypothetical protein NON00_22975 [Roseomonas sp. GC11]|uniref:hypothetical protein n=1 Tax=Roseomonas sp. GC11 TaxID=2950546 RepID=UPI0021098422|nr:hypothetical protein [Roseomonas sp. GC11]MCQ4162773.1 hypothetical protein [Roseomonas sp. GC11]
MPPDTHAPGYIEMDEAEGVALAAAVAAARESGPGVPHEEVREEMLRDIERLRQKVAGLAAKR